ncbi:MAG: nickel-dependent lactate racemase [Symbiobacteriaceae bacterium]|nr:nickel-dependent lactate racemase [Symbiobacteriaceae bacterium]
MLHQHFPYGKGSVSLDIPTDRYLGTLTSQVDSYQPELPPGELVRQALANPIASPPLRELAKGKAKVVILASDHTRPVPSQLLIPPMLAEIRAGNPEAQITLLIATGCHRGTTPEELSAKFGSDLVHREHIVIHDCDNSPLTDLGQLPSGAPLRLNSLAVEADLLLAEGFIEPHFFAGFSGGRKSLMPGVAARETVLYNHNAEFIAHPLARTGILEGNHIHTDALYAARQAKLAFICNVVINSRKEIIHAVAGDMAAAHAEGCAFLSALCQVQAIPADIVVVSNGGYPLDQNMYQAVKGMTAAEATVKPGGVVIMVAQSEDGVGGDEFYQTFSREPEAAKIAATILATPKEQTREDQWQSQIFARVLQKCSVIYCSDLPDNIVEAMHMTPAPSLEAALQLAEERLNNPHATIVTIPDGIGVIVK